MYLVLSRGGNSVWDDELHKMLLDGIKLLSNIGFNHIEVNDIALNNRKSSTLGSYYHNKRLIEISTKHFKYSDKEEVMNTIIHELSHNICDLKHGSIMINDGHSDEWKEIADFISKNTGYKITQYSDEEIPYESIPRKSYYRHYLKCSKCGHTDSMISQYKIYAEVKRKKKCMCCEVFHNQIGNMECVNTYHNHYKYLI